MDRNLEYEKEIKDIVEKHPNHCIRMFKSKGVNKSRTLNRTYLWNYILEQTRFLDTVKTSNITRVIYCLNHITEIPKCGYSKCNNKMPIVKVASATDLTLEPRCCSKYCSRQMAHESFVKHCNDVYGPGITNVFQVPSVIEKSKTTRTINHGAPIPMQSKEIWLRSKKKYTYDGITFDSTWEIVYYEYLKKHGIKFVHEPTSEFTYFANESYHKYYPDFYLPEQNVYVEIKNEDTIAKYLKEGAVFEKPSEIAMCEKIKMLKQLEKENKLIILTSKEMKPYFDWFREEFKQRYKEYLRPFKNK